MSKKKDKYANIDIDAVLQSRREVAVIWSIEDVQELRPDLKDAQAWEVLLECKRSHDCNSGFTWDLIDLIADSLFPLEE